VVGGYLLQVDGLAGAKVEPAGVGGQADPLPRPTPVSILPPRFPGLLDRQEELKAVAEVLPLSPAIEFYGPPGTGKTALLRFLARQAIASNYTDGVAYLLADCDLEDLLLALYRIFYQEEPGRLLDPALMWAAMGKKRALILLDDVTLSREDTLLLLDSLPECAFILAGEERRLAGVGRSMPLTGLPLEAALTLASRELGRPLSEDERTAVQILHGSLDGHPGRIMQAAALARESRRTLADLVWHLPPGPLPDTLAAAILGSLSSIEGQIVAAVCALDGAPAEEEHLAEFLNLPEVVTTVNGLIRRNILQAHSPRYTLAGGLEHAIEDSWDLSSWKERLLEYLAGWAERQNTNPGRLIEAEAAIRKIASWAAATGRWEGLLRLVRASEPAYIIEGHWGAWGRLLVWAQQASQALNDQPAAAWAMHQLGTRALCQGDSETARNWLVRALRQRETLKDLSGVNQTRYNLGYLFGTEPVARPAAASASRAVIIAAPSAAVLAASPPEQTLAVLPAPAPTRTAFNPAPWVIAGLVGSCLLVTLIIVGFFVLGNQGGAPIAAQPTPTGPVLPETGGTPVGTLTPGLQLSPTSCGPPLGWPVYTVKTGETLATIAAATGSTEAQLMSANCLSSPALAVGQQIFVPRLPGPTPAPSATFTGTFVPTATSTPTATPVTPRPPDLTVLSLQAGPYVSLNPKGEFVLPVRVSVSNAGSSPAGDFKVSLNYRTTAPTLGPETLAPFQVPGQADPYFPHSVNSLPPGGQLTFDGQTLLDPRLQGQTIALWAVVDSCAGETNPPPNCRVAESSENNNISSQVLLLIPTLPTATPTATLTPSPTPSPTLIPTATQEGTRNTPEGATPTILPSVTPGLACLDFEDLTLGEIYPSASVILTSNFPLLVTTFNPDPAATVGPGFVQVGAERRAGGSGQELALNSATLSLAFETAPLAGLSLQFGDFDDPVMVAVNGEALTVKDLIELHGVTIGGASVVVFDAEGDGTGSLDFSGSIRSLEIGGKALWLDHLCARKPVAQENP
jgi:hypothetical protein